MPTISTFYGILIRMFFNDHPPRTSTRDMFVRFKDGPEGLIDLRNESFTGALAALRDENFFRRVFIDNGAVAWPGDIDLAPDAMDAEISGKLASASNPAGIGNIS